MHIWFYLWWLLNIFSVLSQVYFTYRLWLDITHSAVMLIHMVIRWKLDFDGIHMNGPMGTSGYTLSILNIVSDIIPVTKPLHHIPPKTRQINPVQSVQSGQTSERRNQQTSRTQGEQQESSAPAASTSCPSTAPATTTTSSAPTVFQYAVKTFNRFSNFLS